MASTQLTRARVEDLVRKSLGITDLADTRRLVEALQRRYPELGAKEKAISLGVLGGTTNLVAPVATVRSGTDYDVDRIRSWLDADFQVLGTTEEARERREEFKGWRDRVLGEFDEGLVAATQLTDGRAIAQVFAAVRKMISFATIARGAAGSYLGSARLALRRVATTIDRAGRLLLKRAGETLYVAWNGFVGNTPGWQTELQEYARIATEALTGMALGSDEAAADIGAMFTLREALRKAGRSHLRVYLDPPFLSDTFRDMLQAVSVAGDAAARRRAAGVVATEYDALTALADEAYKQTPQGGGTLVLSPLFLEFYQALTGFLAEFDEANRPSRLVFFAASLGSSLDSLDATEARMWELLATLTQERDRLARQIEAVFTENGMDGDWAQWAMSVADEAIRNLDEAILIATSESKTAPDLGALLVEAHGELLNHFVSTTPAVHVGDPNVVDWFGTGPYFGTGATPPAAVKTEATLADADYFLDDTRNDFVDLVKDLAATLKRLETTAYSP